MKTNWMRLITDCILQKVGLKKLGETAIEIKFQNEIQKENTNIIIKK